MVLMGFTYAGSINEIKFGEMKSITIANKDILIINYDGNYYVMNRKCTHLGGDLSKGKLENGIITCPNHGSKFDVKNGKCLSGPKMGFLKLSTKDLPIYEVKVEGEKIFVNI